MGSIEIHNVRKSYGHQQVMHGVSIAISDGEFVALVGPSGCGKSTLLRMIAGLEDITDGEIVIGGRVINDVAPKDRDIAMVFQNYALYPHMSVRDNMCFALRRRRLSADEITRRVDSAAHILGLESMLDRKPRALSGGQRQRVAMGRAIVRDPTVFLFDEPLSNLDANLRSQMRSELKELHQRLRTTTVYVTHDQIEAMTLADRVVVMNAGRVEQIGAPLALYDRPASLFVAAFIGSPSMNFIPARVDADGRVARLSDGTILPMPSDLPSAAGKSVTLGIRPAQWRIVEQGCRVAVSIIEPTGSETQISARLAGQTVRILVAGRTTAQVGDTIQLAVDPGNMHVFDPGSGARMD